MRDVLVTGGAGFLGMELVRRLVASGLRPRVLDVNDPNDPRVDDSIEFTKGDVRDVSTVADVTRGVDTVFHLAAAVLPTRGKANYTSINTGGTRNVLQASIDHGVQHVVHISTSAIYGIPKALPVTEETELRPMGYYGNAKREGEREVNKARERGLKVCILRPRTIIGTERLGIFHILFDWIKAGKRIPIIGSGDNLFQFVSARDVVSASILAADKQVNDDFNIGAEEFSTVRGDLESLVRHAGSGSRVVSIPRAHGQGSPANPGLDEAFPPDGLAVQGGRQALLFRRRQVQTRAWLAAPGQQRRHVHRLVRLVRPGVHRHRLRLRLHTQAGGPPARPQAPEKSVLSGCVQ